MGRFEYYPSLNGLVIPVTTSVSPYNPEKKIHRPTPDDPQGPIFERIKMMVERGDKPLISSPHHVIMPIESLIRRHNSPAEETQSDNNVLWIAERTKDMKSVLPWDWDKEKDSPISTSWSRLAQDTLLLDQWEQRARMEVADSNKSFFFVYGFSFRDEDHHPQVAPRSIQSQYPGHGHVTSSVLHNRPDGEMTLIENQTSVDQRFETGLFMDYGVQVVHQELEHRLARLGGRDFANHEHIWSQCDGKVWRRAHPFRNLPELMRQAVELHKNIDSWWRKMVNTLADEYAPEFMFKFKEGPRSLLVLPPSFTLSVFLPSPEEKKQMGLPSNDPHIWAVPGSLADAEVHLAGHWPKRIVEGPPSA